MSLPLLQKDDASRVAALQKYAILDTDPEQVFDDLTLLASFICKTPIALISLVDEKRQWFKSRVGITDTETSREIAFCSSAIQQSDLFIIPDALEDDRFRNNPLVVSDSPHPLLRRSSADQRRRLRPRNAMRCGSLAPQHRTRTKGGPEGFEPSGSRAARIPAQPPPLERSSDRPH